MRRAQERGSVIIFGMILVAILATLSMSFATRIQYNEIRLESDVAGAQALELAKSVNALKIRQMWRVYANERTDRRVALLGGEDQNGNTVLDPGEDANLNTTLDPAQAPTYSDATFVRTGHGEARCTITVVRLNKKEFVDISVDTTARVPSAMNGRMVTRRVEQVVRYGLGPAQVFDYVYFANNYGWMYGNPLYLYGNMGANGNLGFAGDPTVDGKLFAAVNTAIGAAGVVNGNARFDSLDAYRGLASGNKLMRPTNPAATPEDANRNGRLDPGEDTNGNGKLDNYEYEVGYGGTQPRGERQDQINMPYLGDMQMYKDLATATHRPARPEIGEATQQVGGIVKQLKAPGLDPTDPANYNIIIDKTYGYQANQNGKYSVQDPATGAVTVNDINAPLDTADQKKNGNLALIGTPEQPIIVMGPVVVSNDLVIKGVVKGQGTFYVGRNTHVVGDLVYSDPPEWKQNDTTFETTTANNKAKDGVGFGTKGSVVLGNYEDAADFGYARYYMQPPFTQPYTVDQADEDIGYVTSMSGGNPTFHGNYNAADGGKYYDDFDNSPASSNQRRFCESSFPKSYIASIASKPKKLMGIFYTNHYFGGRTNQLELYGSTVMRDEGIVTDYSAKWYYDPRISKGDLSTYIELFLPRNAVYQSLLFRERVYTE
ncbi:MAG TPA: hypothetical protein VEJ63_13575 [Planctomycetota bacterium]|nr:hypothetical protein [Planctomycetota bacterium]